MQSFISKFAYRSFFLISILLANLSFAQSTEYTLEKTANPESLDGKTEVQIGQNIEYTITLDSLYRNGAAEEFTITDETGDGLTIDWSTMTLEVETIAPDGTIKQTDRTNDVLKSPEFCTINQDNFECIIAECAAGNKLPCLYEPSKFTFVVNATVNEDARNNPTNEDGDIEICNTVNGTEKNTGLNKDSTVCHILADQKLDIEMIKGAELYPGKTEVERGEVFNYQLSVKNQTDETLTDIIIEDTIDESLELISHPDFCNEWDEETRLLRCTIETILPQSEFPMFEIEVQVKHNTTADEITNQALLFYNEVTYPSDIVRHTIKDGITISKTADNPMWSLIRPYEPITYTISVHNPTDEDQIGLIIKDVFESTLLVDTATLPEECDEFDETTNTLQCIVDVPAETSINLEVTTVVKNNSIPEICNTAEIVIDEENSILSYPFCNNIGENLWSIEKKSDPVSGESVNWEQTIEYQITIQNTEEGIQEPIVITDILDEKVSIQEDSLIEECEYKNDIHTVTCTIIPEDTEEILTEINIPITVQVKNDTEGTIENTGIMTYLIRPMIPFIESNAVLHEIITPNQPSIEIEKTANIPTTQELQPGQEIIYTITITNTGEETATDITVSDELPINILEVPADTDMPNCEWGGQYITCDASSLLGGESKEFTIRTFVRSANDFTSNEFCNSASVSYQINGEVLIENSESVCHYANGGNGGTGGSGETTPTIGTCAEIPNGYNGYQWDCKEAYPIKTPNHNDSEYQNYKDCLQTREEADCLIEWALAKGYKICGPTNIGEPGTEYYPTLDQYLDGAPQIFVPYVGGSNNDISPLWDQQCTTPIIDESDDTYSNDGTITCADSNHVTATLENFTKEITSGSIIARGDEVTYKITVEPRITKNNSDANITKATLTVYDYTVPSDSGQIWHRKGLDGLGTKLDSQAKVQFGSQYQDWTLSGSVADGIKFQKDIRNDFNTRQEITYTMDSELAIDKDVAQLKNVAFVRLLLEYEITDDEGNTTSGTVKQYFDLGEENICRKDPASLGSSSIVNVIRPFLDVQGGANIGGLQQQEDEHRLFGDVGTIADKTEQEIDVQAINEEETHNLLPETNTPALDDEKIKEYKQNASQTEDFFGLEFETTPDESGIYFGNGSITLNGTFDADGQSKTFILENGNIRITDDFKVKNGFVSFIVQNDNILINKDVKHIEGVFIADKGEIMSNGDSKNPLTISGGLIGDAKDLIGERRYIGNENELKPSMTIIFDLRLLDQTPPGLEDFLGGTWEQTIE